MANTASYSVQVTAVATPTSAQGGVCTFPPAFDVTGPTSGQNTRVSGSLNITAGAGTTAVVVRVRQGANTTTGTVVGVAETDTLAAAASGSIPFDFIDLTNQYLSSQYSLTVQQTGGTAAGTVNLASASVEAAQ